ncbi:Z1 domain-containing protein [Brachybacterium paraconglomeratum]
MTESGGQMAGYEELIGAYEGMLAQHASTDNQDVARRNALQFFERAMPGFRDFIEQREETRRNQVEVFKVYDIIRKDGGRASWYGGAKEHKGEWPSYRDRISKGLPESAVETIHETTEMILGSCASPRQPGDRRKGLVVGHVQSGKTANFTGLITKAVDAGYRIVIVLAGMYSNLRVQTQLRLQKDLDMDDARSVGIAWNRLTGEASDIGADIQRGIGPLRNPANVVVAVVKKHEMRLARVAEFLRSVPDDLLRERGVLIIDDESDQATPNTKARKDLVSTINQRIRDIWKEVPTGAYVAYTATPFANIFIDPEDEGDLYPDDFIVALPEPEKYMGSRQYFDVTQNADDDADEMIHSLAHEVPEAEAEIFTPRPKAVDEFSPEMTPSLESALRWFLIATAIRELRVGGAKNSSMLVHTSQLTKVHELTKDLLDTWIRDLVLSLGEREDEFKATFEAEIDRAVSLRDGEPVPAWDEVWARTVEVARQVKVKMDNGLSDDRLVYTDEEPQTVIAVGGGTLSRGLTLEGLVVSYFLRSSNTYDTLLQMGRWFGFRPRYRDLVRVWMGPGLREDYAHLARVEQQLRDEIATMKAESRTPREFAIKVRAHPGRLEITSRDKMSAADMVRAGLGGTRRQTIYLDRSTEGIRRGQDAAAGLIDRALRAGAELVPEGMESVKARPPRLIRGLSNGDVVAFLRDYWVCPTEQWLQPRAMGEWLDRNGEEACWNLALVSGPGDAFAIGGGLEVGLSRRAPLKSSAWKPSDLGVDLPAGSDVVNIRALMSGTDHMLDLRILADHGVLNAQDAAVLEGVKSEKFEVSSAARATVVPHEGLILLYAIDPDSAPRPTSKTREEMGASGPLIGLGVVFPHAEAEDQDEYYAVQIDDATEEDEPVVQRDDEGDFIAEES